MYGSLWRVQAMAVDDKFISLGDASENVSVIQNQAVALRSGLLVEEKSRRKPGEPPTHNHAVIHFSSFLDILRHLVVLTVADRMGILHHLVGIAGGALVVPLSGIARPGRGAFCCVLGL